MVETLEADVSTTVYIASHNYGRFIRRSIESVLKQSMKDFELIIIDDGSTDDSRAIIEEFRHLPHVRIVLQENRGLVATANLGVRAARGRYVMRLDADDWLDENALLVMKHALDEDPQLALVFPDYFYADESGEITGQERRHDFTQVTLLDQPAHGACSLARRECLLEVGAYSADITCQDGVDLWLKLVERYPVRNINLPLFTYRRHGNNLTEQSERILRQRADIYRRHAERSHKDTVDVVAVIPVRGPSVDARDLSLQLLGDRALIDWTVESALQAEHVQDVVVSTPCEQVIEHIRAAFGDRVVVARRSRDTAGENVSFEAAVDEAVRVCRDGKAPPTAVMDLTVQFPFRDSLYIDKAVNALRIFPIHRVVAVLPEDDAIYQHDGGGLVAVGGARRAAGLRLEREYLYRQAGGLLLRKLTPELAASDVKLGHVVVSRRAAFCVRDATDLRIAQGLVAQ